MYLPNPAVRPADADPVEFIDLPALASEGRRRSGPTLERGDRRPTHLSPQATLDLTRWALEYITELVATHRGDGDDVRAVIYELHAQATSLGRPGMT